MIMWIYLIPFGLYSLAFENILDCHRTNISTRSVSLFLIVNRYIFISLLFNFNAFKYSFCRLNLTNISCIYSVIIHIFLWLFIICILYLLTNIIIIERLSCNETPAIMLNLPTSLIDFAMKLLWTMIFWCCLHRLRAYLREENEISA